MLRSGAVRPRILRFAAALVLAAATLSSPTVASAHHDAGPCDVHRREDGSEQRHSKRLIRCAVRRFGPVPGGPERAICIAERESGLIPDAQSLTGAYLGLFQHSEEYWPWRYETFTRLRWQLSDSALSGRTNALVTIRMVAAAKSWTSAGWRRGEC
jgi:hypothetical protein